MSGAWSELAGVDPGAEASLEVGQEIELRIDGLAAGGDGVGRAPDGRAVFVDRTAPGDRVRVRIRELRPRYARAEPLAVLAPGARAEPRCAVYGSCGGCAWQHVAYDAQCEAKGRSVEEALRRIGHLEPPGPVRVVPSPAAYGYRSRSRVVCAGGRVGYRRRRSREVVAAPECPILVPSLEERLRSLAADPPQGARGDGVEWDLAVDERGARAAPRGADAPPLELHVAGDALRISAGVFFQANTALHGALVRAVAEAAGGGGHAVELFAGAGFFTLSLSRLFARVTAVESGRRAVADLRHNLRHAGRTNVRVVRARVEEVLARPSLARPGPEVVVLDPPRTGLPRGAAPRLAALGARRVVYLSCDPATLARDLAALAAAGYGLRRVEAFDLFPQTPHVEVLAVAERERGPDAAGVLH